MDQIQVRKLLHKLKDLRSLDEIFENGKTEAEKMEKAGHRSDFTRMAQAVIMSIQMQTNLGDFRKNPSNVDRFIEEVEEFLAIF